MKLRRSQLETLRSIAHHGECEAWELAARLRITKHSAQRRLDRLTLGPGFQPLQAVPRIGECGVYYYTYRLTEAGKRALSEEGRR